VERGVKVERTVTPETVEKVEREGMVAFGKL
jgi:hypothetical protein